MTRARSWEKNSSYWARLSNKVLHSILVLIIASSFSSEISFAAGSPKINETYGSPGNLITVRIMTAANTTGTLVMHYRSQVIERMTSRSDGVGQLSFSFLLDPLMKPGYWPITISSNGITIHSHIKVNQIPKQQPSPTPPGYIVPHEGFKVINKTLIGYANPGKNSPMSYNPFNGSIEFTANPGDLVFYDLKEPDGFIGSEWYVEPPVGIFDEYLQAIDVGKWPGEIWDITEHKVYKFIFVVKPTKNRKSGS